MKTSELQKKLDALRNQQELANRVGELNRARSVTIGTAFGGTTELSMRASDGATIWCLMQPAEAIELIHQLAANVGCHIALKPRDDFSSWREWRVSEAEKKHLNGHAPFANDLSVFKNLGAAGFDQAEAEALVAENLTQKEYEYVNGGAVKSQKQRGVKNDNTVATKKAINGRSTKRGTKAS